MISKNLKKNMALITALAVGATLTFSNTNVYANDSFNGYAQDGTHTPGDNEATSTDGEHHEATGTYGEYHETTGTCGNEDEATGTSGEHHEATGTCGYGDEATGTQGKGEDKGLSVIKKYWNISLDKQIVKPGDTVKIKVAVDISKCQFGSTVELTYMNGKKEIKVVLQKSEDGVAVGSLTIPSDAKSGIYLISKLTLTSKEGLLYDSSEKSSMKNLLPNGSIQVKTNDNEKIAPVISDENKVIKDGDEIVPDVDQGSAEITSIDGQKYNGKAASLGKHEVEVTATGIDGTKSTKKIIVNVTGEITTTSTPGEVVEKIKGSTSKEVDITVKKDVKKIDKSIFSEIKGKDKSITLKQENGAEWTFSGTDITDDASIQDIDLTVSTEDKQNSGVKDKVNKITKDAQLIQFDYHGVLPGKAKVKINVGSDNSLKGKSLTLYYYNSDTNKAEKVQSGVTIDADGNVDVEISHCSNYFLSADSNLDLNAANNTGDTTNTGDYSTNIIVILGMMLLAGGALVLNRKPEVK